MKKLMVVLLAAFIGCGGQLDGTVQSPVDIEAVKKMYLYLSLLHLAVASCEAERAPEHRDAIIYAAQQDLRRLRRELGEYCEGDQSGLPCGPVCEGIVNFLKIAGERGLISCQSE